MSCMRATKLIAAAAVTALAAAPMILGQAGAVAAPAEDTSHQDARVTTLVITDRSDSSRELEIIRSMASDRELEIIRSNDRLRTMTVQSSSARELEIIRSMHDSDLRVREY